MKNKSVLIALGLGLAAWVVSGMLGVNSQNEIAFGDTDVKGGLLQFVIAGLASGAPFAWEKFKPTQWLLSSESNASFTDTMSSWESLNRLLKGNDNAEKLLDDLLLEIAIKCRECKDETKTP